MSLIPSTKFKAVIAGTALFSTPIQAHLIQEADTATKSNSSSAFLQCDSSGVNIDDDMEKLIESMGALIVDTNKRQRTANVQVERPVFPPRAGTDDTKRRANEIQTETTSSFKPTGVQTLGEVELKRKVNQIQVGSLVQFLHTDPETSERIVVKTPLFQRGHLCQFRHTSHNDETIWIPALVEDFFEGYCLVAVHKRYRSADYFSEEDPEDLGLYHLRKNILDIEPLNQSDFPKDVTFNVAADFCMF